MNSKHSEIGRRARASALPPELADALAGARERLGRIGTRFIYFETVGSTNDIAASLADAGAEGLVVIADAQTSGRGRQGRIWFSPPGSGLYVSTVVWPGRARDDRARATKLLTLAAGVALAEAIERLTGLIPHLKWPNDLYVSRRKLAGILAEASGSGSGVDPVVLGYGVNVSSAAYPPDLRERATSLELELGRPIDRVQLLVESLVALGGRYDDLLDAKYDAILDAWRRRAPSSVGSRVSWAEPAGPRTGVTAGIDAYGALLVRTPEGVERIVAGALIWL